MGKKLVILLLGMAALVGSPLMTRPGFNAIELGAPVDQIVREHGEPYSIAPFPDGTKEYLYIERITLDSDTIQENRYFVVFKNGQVVAKRCNQERPPAYNEIYDDDPNDVPN